MKQTKQRTPNPELNKENPELNEEENLEDELHEDLNQLIILSDELKNTIEPSQVSLATSIKKIIESINISHNEITSLSEYRARMREHYSTGISKEDIKNLNITKSQLWSKFTNPRTGQRPDVRERRVCMDWCNYQPWRENWRKRWFMVFDKPPCNNVEVPQYFLRKLWADFVRK